MSLPKLYGYWRSTASYRVRLALGLKGIEYEQQPVNLLDGEQLGDAWRALSPQAQVPMLEIDGTQLHQSSAIIEYLEATRPERPLLPDDPELAAQARAFAQTIAADIHPIQNLRVLKYIRANYDQDQDGIDAWATHWIALGFTALERIASNRDTPFLFGEEPAYAECFLSPQHTNAVRFGVDMDAFPALREVIAACEPHPVFRAAHPDAQPDAPAK